MPNFTTDQSTLNMENNQDQVGLAMASIGLPSLNSDHEYMALMMLPDELRQVFLMTKYSGRLFIAGGYITSVILREKIQDIDVFLKKDVDFTAVVADIILTVADIACMNVWLDRKQLSKDFPMGKEVRLYVGDTDTNVVLFETTNAVSIKFREHKIQVIKSYASLSPNELLSRFDFSMGGAVIYTNDYGDYALPILRSNCLVEYYRCINQKVVNYRVPVRDEAAGGSYLRLQKFIARGWTATIAQHAKVLARTFKSMDNRKFSENEKEIAEAVETALLASIGKKNENDTTGDAY